MANVNQLNTFHDAELRSISHLAEFNRLELGFEKADGNFVVISFREINAFRAIDFGLQNVVSRLLIQGVNLHLTLSDVEKRVRWIKENVDGEQLADLKTIARLVQKINSGDLRLFILEPSWGAEVILLAETIAGPGFEWTPIRHDSPT